MVDAHTAEADVKATYEVLKAQLDKYEGVVYEDKHGKKSTPVVNDVKALHAFTNLSNPVDFAGRIVYDKDGDPTINFGKHEGKKIVQVFEIEPSYYTWMMNGDFPLYTKKVLQELWNSYKQSKDQKKQDPKPITPGMLDNLKGKFGS